MTSTWINPTSSNTSTTITLTTTTMPLITASQTVTLAKTTTTTLIAATTIHTFNEKSITKNDWISQDSVVVGITVTCVLLLVLTTLMATGYHFICNKFTAKTGVPVMHP